MIRRLALAALVPAALALASCGVGDATASTVSVENLWAKDLAQQITKGDVILVDVRTPEEFAEGHIEGAVNLPLGAFDPAAVPVAEGKEPVFYCRSGRRSTDAAEQYAAHTKLPATHLDGGIIAWEEAGLPVVKGGADE
ncbi:MAG: rhodanese-like domain-containing protein [Sphingomonadaceae bacterium]|jgi:rhodanese-related sulfurtransferase